jgi:TRAP-type C4-dicarboxylate transport system permease large subunit
MAVRGMAERLLNLAKVFVGFIRGGMALVNILASTMFGCISGSSVADTAAVGSVMIIADQEWLSALVRGECRDFRIASHNMIIYSIAAGHSASTPCTSASSILVVEAVSRASSCSTFRW